jgi:hypothetical protein
MNHHPTRRYRQAIVAASITGLLLAAACGDGEPNVQTEIAPAAPAADPFVRNVEELNALEDYYRAGAAEHPNQTGQSVPIVRPASGPRPY